MEVATMLQSGWKRMLLMLTVFLFLGWGVASAWLFTIMRRPPEQFGEAMKHVPMPAFLVLPFETLWNRARGGELRAGDIAPDFELDTLDRTAKVRLSSFRGSKPVVLVFGSYT